MKRAFLAARRWLPVCLAIPSLTAFAAEERSAPEQWRAERRLVDLHQHIGYSTGHLARAVRIMDRAGIGLGVNLSGGAVTRKEDGPSAFERNKRLADELFPGRFLHYMNLDYGGWDEPEFSARAVKQIEEGHRLGAAGLKEWKRLGLYLRDGAGKLIRIDEAKLDPVWQRCGELNLPVSIHVADPKAFWLPYDESNERWTELKDHRPWWFGDTNIYPPRMELLEALDRVIGRHPKTTFVCVHFANNAEDLDWVERALDRHPNMMADLAARVPEIGRHDPEKVRRLFLKHQDRILFATDFQVYDRLTLGSGGSGPPPTDEDALEFFAKHWRWLETRDRNFPHMTPIQGDWTISGIGLPDAALRKIYFDNARRLLARSWPAPVVRAARIESDFEPDGALNEAVWPQASPARIEYQSLDARARPEVATRVRVLWSDRFLYLGFTCPFTELTVFEPAEPERERIGLWKRDVVEAFIGSDEASPGKYVEVQAAPNGEKLDLTLNDGKRDFDWSSSFIARVKVDRAKKIWTAEMRIPLTSLSSKRPEAGERWPLNFFRFDAANDAYLAWNPTLRGTFHAPEKFGLMEFAGAAEQTAR